MLKRSRIFELIISREKINFRRCRFGSWKWVVCSFCSSSDVFKRMPDHCYFFDLLFFFISCFMVCNFFRTWRKKLTACLEVAQHSYYMSSMCLTFSARCVIFLFECRNDSKKYNVRFWKYNVQFWKYNVRFWKYNVRFLKI